MYASTRGTMKACVRLEAQNATKHAKAKKTRGTGANPGQAGRLLCRLEAHAPATEVHKPASARASTVRMTS